MWCEPILATVNRTGFSCLEEHADLERVVPKSPELAAAALAEAQSYLRLPAQDGKHPNLA